MTVEILGLPEVAMHIEASHTKVAPYVDAAHEDYTALVVADDWHPALAQANTDAATTGAPVTLPARATPYPVNANVTLSAYAPVSGAILKPANGVFVTIGVLVNPPPTQMFDLSLGGVVVLAGMTVLPQHFGAKADGVTDDTTAFAWIVATALASSGLRVSIPFRPLGYRINTGEIVFPTTVPLYFDGDGAYIVHGGSGNVFVLDVGDGTTATTPRHRVTGITFTRVAGTEQTGVAIKVSDSGGSAIEHVRVYSYSKGIQLVNGTGYTETTALRHVEIRDCDTGIDVSKGASSAQSLATTLFEHVLISTGGVAGRVGFSIGTQANLYRAHYAGLTIFPGASSTGFYSDGFMTGSRGQINVENSGATASGNVAFHFGANHTGRCDVFGDLRGPFTTRLQNDASTNPDGFVMTTATLRPFRLFDPTKNAFVGPDMRDPATEAIYYRQQLLTNRAISHQSDMTRGPQEMVDINTSTLAALQAAVIGRRQLAADGDTTPSVADATWLQINNSTATTITGFDDAITSSFPGHPLLVQHKDANTTIAHGTGAAQTKMLDAANFASRAGDWHLFQWSSGDNVWIEVWRSKGDVTGISVDQGDANVTWTPGASKPTIRFNTALTANRAVTIATGGRFGDKLRVVRQSSATGAFALTIKNNAGTLIATLSMAGSSAEFECDSTGTWRLVSSGIGGLLQTTDAGKGSVGQMLALGGGSNVQPVYTTPDSMQQLIFRSPLPNLGGGASMILAQDTAYWVYVGYFPMSVTPKFIAAAETVAGVGTQAAEVAYATTPSAPNKAGQTLTVLAASSTVSDLTVIGVRRNIGAFSTATPAGSHVWVGIRTNMATTQPKFTSLQNDWNEGAVLTTATAGVLAAGNTYAGVIPTNNQSGEAPDLRLELV